MNPRVHTPGDASAWPVPVQQRHDHGHDTRAWPLAAGGVAGAVRSGRLVPGTRLPSSRDLAADLGVSRGLIMAYEQLTRGCLRSSGADERRVDQMLGQEPRLELAGPDHL
jgi:GntR family transcriptional regulator/MocR family aminotransferase